eukprot:SAG31_NODE_2935_length_4895_cov_5.362177_7_plen_84_part_00
MAEIHRKQGEAFNRSLAKADMIDLVDTVCSVPDEPHGWDLETMGIPRAPIQHAYQLWVNHRTNVTDVLWRRDRLRSRGLEEVG